MKQFDSNTTRGYCNGLYTFCCLVVLVAATGCESIRYYGQAITGHAALLMERQPVERIIKDPTAPVQLRQQLALAAGLLAFAERELALPVAGNYSSYVALNRSHVAWNVFAAPEFSLEPKTWCYPVAGCATYRGYFAEQDAHHYAARLQKKGFDVYVGGVVAYSTLGWFDDPLLSTFIDYGETGLAGLLFHELAHRVLYVPDDTAFNESFASTVEQEGVRRWLAATESEDAFAAYLREHQRHLQFLQLIETCLERLESLYKKDIGADEKRREKALVFKMLKKEYEERKQDWNGYPRYDAWFARPLNNAQLLSVAAYNDFVPAFLELLQTTGGDLPLFYDRCKTLGKMPGPERRRQLQKLLSGPAQEGFEPVRGGRNP